MKVLKKLSKGVCLLLVCSIAACNNDKPADTKTAATVNAPEQNIPSLISYDIVKEYPHDPTAFTEGLEFKDGFLYESTGEYGVSDIRKVELATGKVLASHKMDAKYFGEGLTIIGDKMYQLTYREGAGFVYDLKTLKPSGTFSFPTPEGWGMTNNGASMIYDDGSNILHFIDPVSFKEVKRLSVTDEHGPVNELNEMELIKGYLYANVWKTEYIIKIDTATGHVVGRADLSSLRQRAGIPPVTGRKNTPEVMNGIAYDATNNRIYITGKNWPKLLEIKLDN